MFVLDKRFVGLLAPTSSLDDDLCDGFDSELLILFFCLDTSDSFTDSLSSLIGLITLLEDSKITKLEL
jgi:hypothetical protein